MIQLMILSFENSINHFDNSIQQIFIKLLKTRQWSESTGRGDNIVCMKHTLLKKSTVIGQGLVQTSLNRMGVLQKVNGNEVKRFFSYKTSIKCMHLRGIQKFLVNMYHDKIAQISRFFNTKISQYFCFNFHELTRKDLFEMESDRKRAERRE